MSDTTKVKLHGTPLTVGIDKGPDHKFWTKQYHNWERGSFDFLDEFVVPGTHFIDVGAWIGPLTMYALSKGALVVAFEPDPVARDSLVKNLHLNNLNADVRSEALSNNSDGLIIAGGRKGLGRSTTSSMSSYFLNKTSVTSISVQDLISELGENIVLKIDIEGHEFIIQDDLLGLINNYKFPIQLSLHPKILQKHLRNRLVINSKKRAIDQTVSFLNSIDREKLHYDGKKQMSLDNIIADINNGLIHNFDIVLPPKK